MSPVYASKRRADEFEALVSGASAAEPGVDPDVRDADLLELVTAMRAVPEVSARPEFVTDLREQLMAEAQTALTPEVVDDLARLRLPSRRPKRERRLAAIIGAVAVVGATTGVSVASQSALPGDALYPVKRVIERAHTGISVGDASKGKTILGNASDRLGEVEELTGQGDPGNEQRIADTLDTFADEAKTGSDLLFSDYKDNDNASSIARVHDFASTSLDRLAALEPRIPAAAHEELIDAANVLSTLDTEATQLCPDCGGASIESIPPSLAAGAPLTPPQPATPTGPTDPSASQRAEHLNSPDLPDVDQGDLGPGSVQEPSTDPSSSSGSDTGSDTGTDDDRPGLLSPLTDPLTGGGKKKPSESPSLPVVGGVVDGVGNLLGDLLNPLLGKQQP
jgi:hypothetical protein